MKLKFLFSFLSTWIFWKEFLYRKYKIICYLIFFIVQWFYSEPRYILFYIYMFLFVLSNFLYILKSFSKDDETHLLLNTFHIFVFTQNIWKKDSDLWYLRVWTRVNKALMVAKIHYITSRRRLFFVSILFGNQWGTLECRDFFGNGNSFLLILDIFLRKLLSDFLAQEWLRR